MTLFIYLFIFIFYFFNVYTKEEEFWVCEDIFGGELISLL